MVNDLILQVDGGHVLWVGHSYSQQDAHQQVDHLKRQEGKQCSSNDSIAVAQKVKIVSSSETLFTAAANRPPDCVAEGMINKPIKLIWGQKRTSSGSVAYCSFRLATRCVSFGPSKWTDCDRNMLISKNVVLHYTARHFQRRLVSWTCDQRLPAIKLWQCKKFGLTISQQLMP